MSDTDVAHYDGLAFWAPLISARADQLVDLLGLAPGANVLDVGQLRVDAGF